MLGIWPFVRMAVQTHVVELAPIRQIGEGRCEQADMTMVGAGTNVA